MIYNLDDPYDEPVFHRLRKSFGPIYIGYGKDGGVFRSSMLRDNLMLIDARLPGMLSDMIEHSYSEMEENVLTALQFLEERYRECFYLYGIYREKVGAMLAAMATTLTLDSVWEGRDPVYGESILRDRLLAVSRFEICEVPSSDGLLLKCNVILN